MASVLEDLYMLVEETLSCELSGMLLMHEGRVVAEFGIQENCAHTNEIKGDNYTISLFSDEKISPDEKQLEHIRKILNIYLTNQTDSAGRAFCGAEIIDTITSGKTIDDVLRQLVSVLVNRGGFTRAAVMFLNEALLELRGVIFADSSGNVDATSFKKTKLIFETKNQLSDVMFYDRTDIVSSGDIAGLNEMSEYFEGDIMVTGLGVGDMPIGILLASREDYNDSDKDTMLLYGNICSLSIEFSRTVKQLELTKKDLAGLRKTAMNAENLVKMGRLSATVAHELKNPLVAIGGFTKRMEQTAVNPQTKNYIKIVQSEVHRLERIVGDILVYSRKVDLDIKEFAVQDLVNDVMELANGCLCFSMIHLKLKVGSDLVVKADRDKMKQVLMNLVSNSVQEMQEGGELRIEAMESDRHITVSVSDTGGGIPSDKREKIFEPFYTLKKSGTGLGLPLCKKIMTAHGGDIVVGEVEDGAIFTLIIPKKEGKMAKKKILIIDDEEHIRAHYKELLEEQGFEVRTAEDGIIGLAIFKDEKFDLILLDVNMPEKSGLEVLKDIKAIDDHQVVFLLTAYDEYKRNFASLYAEEYFTKDKKIDILLRRIAEHLDG